MAKSSQFIEVALLFSRRSFWTHDTIALALSAIVRASLRGAGAVRCEGNQRSK